MKGHFIIKKSNQDVYCFGSYILNIKKNCDLDVEDISDYFKLTLSCKLGLLSSQIVPSVDRTEVSRLSSELYFLVAVAEPPFSPIHVYLSFKSKNSDNRH